MNSTLPHLLEFTGTIHIQQDNAKSHGNKKRDPMLTPPKRSNSDPYPRSPPSGLSPSHIHKRPSSKQQTKGILQLPQTENLWKSHHYASPSSLVGISTRGDDVPVRYPQRRRNCGLKKTLSRSVSLSPHTTTSHRPRPHPYAFLRQRQDLETTAHLIAESLDIAL